MGRWAKSHDQRKGQWLVNAIRETLNYDHIKTPADEKTMIELRLWNMDNKEFEAIMEKYYA